MSFLRVCHFLIRNALSKDHQIKRVPETEIMGDHSQTLEFHQQGEAELLPLYLFNASSLSLLIPCGGTLLDLGSGSGQCMKVLAKLRPDIRIFGLELSESMLELGNQMLEKEDLAERIRLIRGDMTLADQVQVGKIDAISAIFSLHHLPNHESLQQTLAAISKIRARFGCAIWIFDHTRPKSDAIAGEFPEALTPHASRTFKEDSKNSLRAAFTRKELQSELAAQGLDKAVSDVPVVLSFYQIHWMASLIAVSAPSPRLTEFDSVSLKKYRGFSLLWRKAPTSRRVSTLSNVQ